MTGGRRHTRYIGDWSSDVCSSDLQLIPAVISNERTAVVLAQREGVLVGLSGQENARVAQGEELARLNDDDLRAQLHQAELEANRITVEIGRASCRERG